MLEKECNEALHVRQIVKIQTFVEHFNEPLYLESGRILESYDLKYETYGELNEQKNNMVVVFHALTGSHHAAGRYENDGQSRLVGSSYW